ncbi:hypothetical protein AB3464_04640 [Pseudomonas asplenii]|uniref:hypothetical protein n=1 Tax=Pseudomonas asplenii TaxID=53407 RepID=UPI0037CBCC89
MYRKYTVVITLGLLASIAITTVPYIYTFHSFHISTDPASWGVFGDYFGGVLSTIISILGFIAVIVTIRIQSEGIRIQNRAISAQLSSIQQEQEIKDDEVYSKQAIDCLAEALAMLTDPVSGGLYRNRIAWIECARFILTAKNLSKNIKSRSVRLVYETTEKLSRSKFSNRLDLRVSPETTRPGYFGNQDWEAYARDQAPEILEKYSIYVIYKFASWQQDEDDILEATREEMQPSMINRRYFGARLFFEGLENNRNET